MTITLNDQIMTIFYRTLKNCKFYEEENNLISLANEIGVLRGIYYCMEEIGFDLDDDDEEEFHRFIAFQQDIKMIDINKDKEVKECDKDVTQTS